MAKATKFGTFAGVFTPAIMTILGVIMYMRMPWVVGNAGLWMAIGIVAAAHLVSVTTGLSVSSMATDKRVKAGGSYYILSRSLGLPIGGALGIALFVGLSFGVSLYVIGFSESVLGYFNYEATTNNVRIMGSVGLGLVATVALISTAFAMKMQYVVMAAMVISLISIAIGSDAPPAEVLHVDPLPDGAGFAIMFGIFFPAVTGFEAGVSMSGDLKDPKRSIPVGTMAAVLLGLAVYIVLAVFFAWRIPAEALANNPRVLLDYAWIEELVVPGIWLCTLSSALGSILGGPRILQACAADGIGPRFFERGHGASNEPRRALIMSTFIAWCGVMVGELDTIARIVSMFFLTGYGFLNLAAFFESWVSPDFRPDFRIPRVVSLIGAITCFMLMIQMDIAAMFAATAAMAFLYALIKRRELALEAGDTWSGVWAAMVRWSLSRLSRGEDHQRNWRPRVLSFGGESVRALSDQLAGRSGFVSDLSEHVSPVGATWDDRLAATKFHGLPGLQPNVVLLSVDELVETPAPALAFIERLDPERYNVVVTRGRSAVVPGRIDIWWRGRGGSIMLALGLVRSITTHRAWRRAGVRFYLPVASAAERRTMERRISHLLDQARVQGDIRTVDPDVMPPIQKLSADAALVILGLPLDKDAGRWATRVQDLVNDVPNCVLVRPATFFKNPLGDDDALSATAATQQLERADRDEPWSRDATLAELLDDLQTGLADAFIEPFWHADRTLFAPMLEFADVLHDTAERTSRRIQKLQSSAMSNRAGAVGRLQVNAWGELAERIAVVGLNGAAHQQWLVEALDASERALGDVVLSARRVLRLQRVEVDGTPDVALADSGMTGLFRGRNFYLQAELNDIVAQLADVELQATTRRIVAARLELTTALHAAATTVARSLRDNPGGAQTRWRGAVEELRSRIESVQRNERAAAHAVANTMVERVFEQMQNPRRHVLPPRAVTVTHWLDPEELGATIAAQLSAVDDALNTSRLDLQMEVVLHVLRTGIADTLDRFSERLHLGVFDDLDTLRRALDREEVDLPTSRRGGEFDAGPALLDLVKTVEAAVAEVPDTVRVVPEVVLANIEAAEDVDEAEVRTIAVRQLVGYLLESEVVAKTRDDARKVERVARRGDDLLRDALRMQTTIADDGDDADDASVLDELRARAEEVHAELTAAEVEFRDALTSRLSEVAARLDASQIVAESAELSRFARTQAQRELVSTALRSIRRWHVRASQRLIELSHRLDAGWEAVQSTADGRHGVVEDTARFQRSVAPDPAVMRELPVFFRRTFRSHTLDPALLVQADVLDEARTAIRHHEAGSHGALLISGTPGAGTTTIARRVVSELLSDRPIVEIRPRPYATASATDFQEAVRGAVRGSHSSMHAALRSLTRGTVILIHDIDLWWLRSSHGFGALDEIQRIADEYSTRFLFILTAQSSTVALLRRLQRIESLLLGHIQARPLDAASAMEAVLLRQRSTGYEIRFQDGEPPTEFGLARYFSSLRHATGGAVGPLLLAWVARFTAVDSTSVTIGEAEPQRPRFGDLRPEWVTVVTAVALQRRLRLAELTQVLGEQIDTERIVATLQRANLFTVEHGVVELDEFIRPYVVRWLLAQGMLG